MPKDNPFPKLTEFAKANPDSAIAKELRAYLEAAIKAKPRSKNYDFYEYIGVPLPESEGDNLS